MKISLQMLTDNAVSSIRRYASDQSCSVMVYYVNGQVWRKYFSVNGNQHGECFSFYDDGRVCSKSFYINGKLHGEFIGYHRDGSVDWHYLYVNGELLLDLKESPVDNEEKMLLSLQYGVEWL